ncbi:MAG: hypothetical protein GY859_43245, partial [Desulfobacterales bacterium]|nr:hypothetical protein [Desulfobacterales bacterium]
RLPKEFEMRLSDEIAKIEEDYKMPYVTTWERMAKEDGVKEEKRKTVINLLKEGVDKTIIANATGFPLNKIEELAAEAR